METFKERLVARWFTLPYNIDYQETFALVTLKMNNTKILISLVNNLNWPLQQFDIKSAFLYGDLKEEVYIKVPLGFTNKL